VSDKAEPSGKNSILQSFTLALQKYHTGEASNRSARFGLNAKSLLHQQLPPVRVLPGQPSQAEPIVTEHADPVCQIKVSVVLKLADIENAKGGVRTAYYRQKAWLLCKHCAASAALQSK